MPARFVIEDLTVSVADQERKFSLRVPHLSLASGEMIGLSGSSGSGKTMMLEVLGLLRRPSRTKRFVIEDNAAPIDLSHAWSSGSQSPPDIRANLFGFVPQSGGLLPFLNVAENIALSQKISERSDQTWLKELIARLGLTGVQSLHPGALSIGQRQRVAIARALAHRPAFVIADEPTAALDPDAAENVMRLMIEAAQSGGSAVIMSSHDLTLLERFAMRRLTMNLSTDPESQSVESCLCELEPAQ